MGIVRCIMFSMLVAFVACTNYGDYGNYVNTDNTDWDKGGEAYYNNVINLQTEAGEKYSVWSQTMDSLEAIKKLQQFFLDDTTVTSATIGSQGIAVEYSNGMRGGIFLDPQNDFGEMPLNSGSLQKTSSSDIPTKSVVNNKRVIVFFPNYWQWTEASDIIENEYNTHLPDVGYSLTKVYKNTDATIDRFTELSGYGIIHFDSHGCPWPSDSTLSEVYFQTGEKENKETSKKYWKEIKDSSIAIIFTLISQKYWDNVYHLSPKFITSHNNFSKDTVLFIGGFCYSFLGGWSGISGSFANGGSFGFGWSVDYREQLKWAQDLIGRLCDKEARPPCSTGEWMDGAPKKRYYDKRSKRDVSICYTGDQSLTLWQAPVIETLPVTDVGTTTAKCGGNVKTDGGFPITEKGLCWSTSQMPTTSDSHTLEGGGIGTFINTIDNLTPSTQYSVRAYAINKTGTFYGKQKTILTEESDDKDYKTVTIGTQTWMAENLAYLPYVSPPEPWSDSIPFYYVYGYSGTSVEEAKATANYTHYGVLYNWPAAKTACPKGWHLPSDEEWKVLEIYLGMTQTWADIDGWRESGSVGKKLKFTSGWDAAFNGGNGNGDNSSGFAALSGGYRSYYVGGFFELGSVAKFWSSSEYGTIQAWERMLDHSTFAVLRGDNVKNSGLSVRCLMD